MKNVAQMLVDELQAMIKKNNNVIDEEHNETTDNEGDKSGATSQFDLF